MLARRMIGAAAARRAPLAIRARALSSALPSLPDIELTQPAEHVVLATLDRPTRGNSFSLAMAESLLELPTVLPESTRALIFTGRGEKAFCTGRDLAESKTHTPEQAKRYIKALIDGVLGVKKLPMPTIAAINGAAFGGGVELALCCDIRVAAAEATLCLPETALGIFPGAAGAVLTPRLLGAPRAKELIFTARRFSGVEAEKWGVVQHVTSAGGPDALGEALALGEKIAANGPLGVRGAKRVIDAIDEALSFEQQLEVSNAHRLPLNDTDDFKEALKAFAEKRKPVFHGK